MPKGSVPKYSTKNPALRRSGTDIYPGRGLAEKDLKVNYPYKTNKAKVPTRGGHTTNFSSVGVTTYDYGSGEIINRTNKTSKAKY